MARSTRRRLSRVERRLQLLGVARAIFASRGFEAASIEKIAQHAGVTKPVVYEHFGSKEGLHAAVVEREMEELVAHVVAGMSHGSARQRWEGAVAAFLGYVDTEPAGFAVLTRGAPFATGRRGLTRVIDDLAERIGDTFTQEFRRAGYPPRLAPIYANALLGSVTQVGQWWAEGGKVLSRDHVARHLAALGWMGLRHLPRSPARVAVTPSAGAGARSARSS